MSDKKHPPTRAHATLAELHSRLERLEANLNGGYTLEIHFLRAQIGVLTPAIYELYRPDPLYDGPPLGTLEAVEYAMGKTWSWNHRGGACHNSTECCITEIGEFLWSTMECWSGLDADELDQAHRISVAMRAWQAKKGGE